MTRLILVLASTLVILGYLYVIWWLDRYEREPWWMVSGMFLWGALGATLLGCLASLPFLVVAQGLIGPDLAPGFNAVVIAPIVEEAAKAAVFLPVLLTASFGQSRLNFARELDTATDGFIYGAAIGLGFATTENLLYYAANYSASLETLVSIIGMRTAFSALVHTTSSGLLGMAIVAGRQRPGRWLWWAIPVGGYLTAVFNHAIWNGLAVASQFHAGAIFGGIACLLGTIAVTGLLTHLCLRREHQIIRRYLQDEADRGNLPDAHADIIPFWSRRRKVGWLPDHIDHSRYVQRATLLAFRRYQLERDRGRRASRLQSDISSLRDDLSDILRQD